MTTLEQMEVERGIPNRIVDGPFPERHLRKTNHPNYDRDITLEQMKRKYKLSLLPIIGPMISLFYR